MYFQMRHNSRTFPIQMIIISCSLVPRPLPDFISQLWSRLSKGKRVTPCLNKCLHSDHCLQGSSELGLNGLDNLYIPTRSLAICFFVLDGSGPSAETCLDMDDACPQPAAFFSRCTRITPSTYVYTSFISDLVLAKSTVVDKTPRQTLLFDRLLYWLHNCVDTLPLL